MNEPAWVVRQATPRPDYTIELTFADGTRKIYDARPLLEKPVYALLRSAAHFMSARAECGTVVWDEDVDIAPEHLYETSVPVTV